MPRNRDFFGFCTSLKPLEMKALGALSEVRHIGAGETIYSAGDEADALYIISRGMVEMMQENVAAETPATYLSRGDIFGALELLSGTTRRYRVRSCDGVSLRVFGRRHFDELVERVPSFFRYLSEQLAVRLLQTRDLAVVRSHCRELSGSLSQFDLVTIYQTITHSSQTGELTIRSEAGEVVAAFWFDCGQARSGRFQHLRGEEAFVQLFLAGDLRGTFSFDAAAAEPPMDEEDAPIISHPHELLIRSLQARDEFGELRLELADPSALLRQVAPALDLESITEELRPTAKKLWHISLAHTVSIEELRRHCNVSELTIYRTARELLRSGHFAFTEPSTIGKNA